MRLVSSRLEDGPAFICPSPDVVDLYVEGGQGCKEARDNGYVMYGTKAREEGKCGIGLIGLD